MLGFRQYIILVCVIILDYMHLPFLGNLRCQITNLNFLAWMKSISYDALKSEVASSLLLDVERRTTITGSIIATKCSSVIIQIPNKCVSNRCCPTNQIWHMSLSFQSTKCTSHDIETDWRRDWGTYQRHCLQVWHYYSLDCFYCSFVLLKVRVGFEILVCYICKLGTEQ